MLAASARTSPGCTTRRFLCLFLKCGSGNCTRAALTDTLRRRTLREPRLLSRWESGGCETCRVQRRDPATVRCTRVQRNASRQSGMPGHPRSATQQTGAPQRRWHDSAWRWPVSAGGPRLDGDQGKRPGVGGQQACQGDGRVGDLIAHAPVLAQQRGPFVRAPHQLRVAAFRTASVQSDHLEDVHQRWPVALVHGNAHLPLQVHAAFTHATARL